MPSPQAMIASSAALTVMLRNDSGVAKFSVATEKKATRTASTASTAKLRPLISSVSQRLRLSVRPLPPAGCRGWRRGRPAASVMRRPGAGWWRR